MRKRSRAALPLLLLAGCADWPRDSNDTLERVTAGGEPLRVGYSAAEPWVRGGEGLPRGLEPDLVRAWARAHRVRVQWVPGGETQQVEALAGYHIDAAVGGFADSQPHGAKIGATQPYLDSQLLIATVPDRVPPESWDGVAVRYDARRPDVAGRLKAIGAVPVPARPGELKPFAAVYAHEVDALGLAATDKVLAKERRVIAVAPAENRLALSLDRFLLARKGEIEAMAAGQAAR